MPRFSRPIYRRNQAQVAVRPFSSGGDKYEPGDKVNRTPHIMQHLYKRRKIGPVGHPWTLEAIANQKGHPKSYSTVEAADTIVNDGLIWVADGKRFHKKSEAVKHGEAERDPRPWTVKGKRFSSKGDAEEWLAEN